MILFLSSQSVYILFPFLIALARTSNTMLRSSGDMEHPYLPNVSGKAYNFSSLYVMLAVDIL